MISDTDNEIIAQDTAEIHEKPGQIYLKMGDREKAGECERKRREIMEEPPFRASK